ncbi:MAG: Dihydrolipoamide acetyltransferase component of pyruvate dehydrogenase complex [Rhodanobacteraceae bacterium]|jgi:pyruvate dehydrogenase E2 component (dihydrolipoamide acetyltransferase)|nr:MAG: Dihydrolipoamide acetyltransferase component of pyruvate dehydrogenase complex [Rhodanobacteraceae bacterium]
MADVREAKVPDIGDFQGVPVIEVMVKPGDRVEKDQGLVTLESAKATMEVPAPFAGTVKEMKVKVGDEVSEGSVIATIEAEESGAAKPEEPAKSKPAPETPAPSVQNPPPAQQAEVPKAEGGKSQASPAPQPSPASGGGSQPARSTASESTAERHAPPIPFDADSIMPNKVPYATPAVRAFARELGVDLSRVAGSERGGRITREDVQKFVKSVMSGQGGPHPGLPPQAGEGGLRLLPWPQIDFSKFGETETQPLSRIKKLSGANLARNWAMIPHVTQFEDADITDLEALRVALNKENEKSGIKVTMLAFLIKASVAALQKYPDFNASLDASGENLIVKKYFHIGFAADTPNGLVVPVIRDCDKKGVLDIAREMSALAKKARDGKLTPGEMSGGCFSISSLGGIGGTMFTPIINAPEVAILGVSRSSTQPVWNGKEFAPRLILPLSLSYDHRVIDGAAAARFAVYLAQLLADMRRALL